MKKHIATFENESLFLDTARSEMKRFDLDISKYSLRALRIRANEYAVICRDANIPEDEYRGFGSSGEVPKFEVLLDEKGTVSKAYFAK